MATARDAEGWFHSDHVGAGVGIYALTYSYTDGNNCTAAATTTVVVDLSIGLENAPSAPIKRYPNPNHGTFSITGLPPGCEIEIWRAWGQKIFVQVADVSVLEVSIQDISKGTYMVKIVAHGRYTLRKVVVQWMGG